MIKTFSSKVGLCMFALGIQSLVMGQTLVNGSRVQIGSWDASGAAHTLPSKRGTIAQLPATCTQGEEYFATDAAAAQNKYYCTATNTWMQAQGANTFLQSGAGAISRSVIDKLRDSVHVKDFGAKGDGATDDTAAFAAALASGASEVRADNGVYKTASVVTIGKGQVLRYGPGSHLTAGIRFTDSTTDQSGTGKLICAGSGVSTLTLLAGANRDVVSQSSFSSLTTKNSSFGLFRAEVSGCTIDGDKGDQTAASYGIRLYGHGLVLNDVTVRNAYSDGIYTEWGMDSSFSNANADLEGYFTNIRSMFNGGNGWTFRGPHDSDFSQVVLYQNSGWGISFEMLANTYNGNGHLSNVNTFLNGSGGIYSNASFDGTQVAGTSNGGWGLLIDSGAGTHNLSSGNLSGPTGLEVRAPSQHIAAVISNTTVAGLKLNGGSGIFTLEMSNNTGYQVDFSSENGPSTIFANSGAPPAGSLMNGTPAQNDFVYLDFGGPASNRYMAVPVNTIHVAGWSPQFPQSNATMAVVDDSSQTGTITATTFNGALAWSKLTGVPAFAPVATSGSYTDLTNQPTLSGDATGALSATVVGRIQGRAVANTAPTDGQTLLWNAANSRWQPGTVTGGSGTGTTYAGNLNSATLAASATSYAGTSMASFGGSPNTRNWFVPAACTLKNLYVGITGPQPATGTLTFNLLVNAPPIGNINYPGSSTGLTVQFAAGAATGTILSDLTDTYSVPAGSLLVLQAVNAAPGVSANVGAWSVSCQ